MRLLILILALLFVMNDDGAKKGRQGNELYRNEDYVTAASLFAVGIQEQNSTIASEVHSGLWNNLGASLFRLGKYDEARQAFGNAVALAPSSADVARSAYNAGNNAFEAFQQTSQQPMAGAPQQNAGQAPEPENLQDVLAHYKQAMLADPANEDAKFNYEFVKRKLDEQEENQDQEPQDQENQDQQNNENEENQQDQQQQNQDQQDQEQNQEQQQQNQQQQQEQQENQEEQQQQEQQPPPDPNKLSREEAEQILQALQNEEEELLRQVMKSQTRPKKVEKDW